jgi:hypothetical protein
MTTQSTALPAAALLPVLAAGMKPGAVATGAAEVAG